MRDTWIAGTASAGQGPRQPPPRPARYPPAAEHYPPLAACPCALARFVRSGSARRRSQVRQVAQVIGPASTALSMPKVARRALEHDDEEARRLGNALLAESERSPALRRRR